MVTAEDEISIADLMSTEVPACSIIFLEAGFDGLATDSDY